MRIARIGNLDDSEPHGACPIHQRPVDQAKGRRKARMIEKHRMKDGVEDFLVVADPRQLKVHKDDVIESLSRVVDNRIRAVSIREPTADPLDDSLLPLSDLGLIVAKLWNVFCSVVKVAESGCFAV